jgi:hypothetical protein
MKNLSNEIVKDVVVFLNEEAQMFFAAKCVVFGSRIQMLDDMLEYRLDLGRCNGIPFVDRCGFLAFSDVHISFASLIDEVRQPEDEASDLKEDAVRILHH